jgi:colanic acid biosynthesis glycosyl transferase WcaI
VIGVIVGRLRRVPVVYNVQDLYPEVAAATGAMTMGVPLRLLGALMRKVYKWSAAVVVIDESFVEVIERAEPRAHVVAVRNAIDRSVFVGASRDAAYLRSVGVDGERTVLMYAGNVGRSQDLLLVASTTADLGVDFVVHGDGAGLEALQAECATNGWSHVHFSGYRDRSELGRIFASADLHVVPLKAGVASASVPSKLLSIFSAGRAAVVLAERASAAAAIVDESGGGWTVDPSDEAGVKAVLADALGSDLERRRRGEAALAWAEQHAGMDRFAREYEGVLIDAQRGGST